MNNDCRATRRRSFRLTLPEHPAPVIRNIGDLLAEKIASRSGAKPDSESPDSFEIKLAIDRKIDPEGFEIADHSDGVAIIGADDRGVLYGAGKFLRICRYEAEGFIPGSWRGASRPGKPVRGIYFATHFYNYYQTAPVGEIEKYVAELALWGVNALVITSLFAFRVRDVARLAAYYLTRTPSVPAGALGLLAAAACVVALWSEAVLMLLVPLLGLALLQISRPMVADLRKEFVA